MDKVDLKIVGMLMQDAQIPFSEIAKMLDLGVDTIIRRYNKLKSEGVIRSATVIVDLKKCGFTAHAFFLVNIIAGADPEKLFEEFTKITNVLTVIHTIGDYDLVLHGIYSDIDNLKNLEKEITKIAGIQYFTTICVSIQDFLPTFPSIGYYSKATKNDPTKKQAKPKKQTL